MKFQNSYRLNIESNRLYFSTPSFKAEKESVLHEGIYNYELSSMLAALFLSGIVYIIAVINFKATSIHYLASTFTFMISFMFFRSFIFRKRELQVVFDNETRMARIKRPGIIGMRKEQIPFSNIQSIEVGSRHILPVNIDGIKFVQKISAQHGSPIPGLGEEKEFVTLILKLTDGREQIIYAEKIENNNEPSLPLKEIREFIKVQT
jgi:uncharacterized integral membrane protein